jgi:hypothetical protein
MYAPANAYFHSPADQEDPQITMKVPCESPHVAVGSFHYRSSRVATEGDYSADIFRFATSVFQETAKVMASKNMFISVSGMVQNGCG